MNNTVYSNQNQYTYCFKAQLNSILHPCHNNIYAIPLYVYISFMFNTLSHTVRSKSQSHFNLFVNFPQSRQSVAATFLCIPLDLFCFSSPLGNELITYCRLLALTGGVIDLILFITIIISPYGRSLSSTTELTNTRRYKITCFSILIISYLLVEISI